MNFTEEEIKRLALFPEQNPNPVLEADLETLSITYMNPSCKKHFQELGKEGMNHQLFEEINKKLSFKKDFTCEVTVSSHIFEQKIFFSPVSNLIRVYSSDITERKQVEKNLKRLASFPEQNPSPIIEFDLDGNITYFNPACLLKFPDFYEQKLNHPLLTQFKSNLEKFRTGELKAYSEEIKMEESHYDQRVKLIPESNLIRMFCIDITQQKQTEELIREKQKEILDSFHYAKRIQQSLLPSDKYIEKTLKRLMKK